MEEKDPTYRCISCGVMRHPDEVARRIGKRMCMCEGCDSLDEDGELTGPPLYYLSEDGEPHE